MFRYQTTFLWQHVWNDLICLLTFVTLPHSVDKVAPGPIADTPGTTKLAPGFTAEDIAEMITDGIPLGRLGTAFDIGMAAVFLASEAASYITGDILVVDGGEWLYKPPMVPKEMVAELSRKVEAKSMVELKCQRWFPSCDHVESWGIDCMHVRDITRGTNSLTRTCQNTQIKNKYLTAIK